MRLASANYWLIGTGNPRGGLPITCAMYLKTSDGEPVYALKGPYTFALGKPQSTREAQRLARAAAVAFAARYGVPESAVHFDAEKSQDFARA